ncbi:ATP-dependent DNA helicase pif1-like [Daktulosphaira vitifoliae]|nr:ATP-dependent DNA helicase pif1-like [Daktulosphaira vitifoliae]
MRAVGDTRRRLPKLFYVSGAGGCGKTFLYNCLISAIRSRGGTVISVAYTGIAASLIQGGQTVHSTFGVRVAPHDQEDPSYLAMQSRKAQALRAASLIVWDEASMSPTSQLRVADRLLRDVMNVPDTPFGGKPVLFAGDFRQTLPIVKRGSRAQIVSATIRHGVY